LRKKTHSSGPAVAVRRRLASTVVQARDGFIGCLTRQHCDELDHISTRAPTMLTNAVLAPTIGVIAVTQRIIRLLASSSTRSTICSMRVRTILLRVAFRIPGRIENESALATKGEHNIAGRKT
jgi:hypothetical protein